MPKEYEFIKEFECKGEWWLPKNKKEKAFGLLKFDIINGGKLEINLKLKQLYFQKVLILGNTDKGDITLFDCALASSSASLDKLSSVTFKFNEGVIGKHVLKRENLSLSRMDVNFSYLNAWSDSFGVKPKETLISFLRRKDEFSFKLPQPFLLTKGEDYKIYLRAATRKGFSFTDTSKQIALEEIPYLSISLQGKNTFKKYMKFVKSMQYFLTLAVREQVFPLISTGVVGGNKPLKFFQRLSSMPTSETILIANFTFSSIKENSNEYLKKWISKMEILKPVCELFFNSLNKNFSLELRFLYLIQAVEGLHRAVCKNNKYITDEEYTKKGGVYKTLSKAIPDFVSSDFKQSLVKKLFYANEYPLRKRLKEMLKDTYLEVINARKIILEKNQCKDFIDKTVNTRNYYVHLDKELKGKILKGKELERAIKVLEVLTEIVLMSEIGIPLEKIKELRQKPKILYSN